MREGTVFFGLAASGLLGAFLLLQTSAAPRQQEGTAKKQAQIERGKYLVDTEGCGCHTPRIFTAEPRTQHRMGGERDTTRLLSGYDDDAELPEIPEGVFGLFGSGKWYAMLSYGGAWAGEWGVSFPYNLTPDVETGLGSWTEEMFIKAMRTGKDMGEGRDILPPMPWAHFAEIFTDEDLKAIFAYLGSLKPIDNPVPDPISRTGERLVRGGQE